MTAPRRLRGLAAGAVIVAILLLPALVAGSGMDRPPAPQEWQRLERAVAVAGSDPASSVADSFLRACVPTQVVLPAAESAAGAGLLAQARLAQCVGLVAAACLAYFAIALTSGRVQALGTVACTAMLPPIATEGHVLRPETAVLVFGLLAVLLLQCIPIVQRPAIRTRRPALTMTLLGATAGVAIGCAVATVPSAGILLLVPGATGLMAAAQLVHRLLRAMRRRSLDVVPLRAITARLWPWVAAALSALAGAVLLLALAVRHADLIQPTTSATGLLPASALLRWPLLVLLGLGALRLLLRTGLRLGRRGRLGSDFVLLVYVAVLLLQRLLRPGDEDALPAVVPVALLLAEGCVYATLLGANMRRRRR